MSEQRGRGEALLSGENGDALVFAGLHAFAFALSTVVIKFLSTSFPALEQVFARALVGLLVLAPAIWRERAGIFSPAWPLLLFRGVAGFVGVFCLFYTVGRLPLVVAMILTLATPVFVMLIGAVALKERISPDKALYSLCVLASVLLVVYPFGDPPPSAAAREFSEYALDVAIGVFGSIASAAAFVSIRAALRTVSVKVVVFYFLVANGVLSLLLGASAFVQPGPFDLVVFVGLGLLGILSDMFKTRAYKKALAGIVSVLSLMSIAFAAVFGWLFFGEPVTVVQLAGVGGLVIGVLLLSLPERNGAAARA